ncbi:hypothetical protein AWU65_14615 [Paenibacillus glucanolyticus]|uniref:Uncharacterized protein n=1 Tax=Paenibacillus glucanolyticus TaxID=59843 RepID=A0A163K9D4_9BACL|nr:hypothetical protein [Paenibacillus glucanolyticus]KZS47070.1 hypothetical protein AWU65_14615 [Paenibacillus glucanolyticus]
MADNSLVNWNFPLNNGGSKDGFNNPGMYHFKTSKWDSLARETIQNSTDAKSLNNDGPVRVEFKMHTLPASEFPRRDEFERILEQCKAACLNNTKALRFFEKSLQTIAGAEIKMLKISDYGTKGVDGSTIEDGDWDSLVKSTGVSNKPSGDGGSYGIGKHAPFACSDLQCVFYGTLSEKENVTAFQGVSMLVSHRNEQGELTRGTGWYHNSQENLPLRLSDLPTLYNRNEPGTDLYIAGFSYEPDWSEEVINSVLENFFLAIADNRLVVKVEDTLIDTISLPDLLEKHLKGDAKYYAYHYYKALSSPTIIKNDLLNMGQVRLHLLEGKEFPKRVAMVRKTGMKIFDKGSFQVPIKFAGIFVAEGGRLNEILRGMEPPDHRNWVPDLYEVDPKLAKKVKDAIFKWINENVNKLLSLESSEALDVDLMNQFLPDEDEEKASDAAGGPDGEKTDPLPVTVKDIVRKPSDPVSYAMQEVATASEWPDGEDRPDEGGPKPGDKPGSERPDGEGHPDEGEPKPDDKPGSERPDGQDRPDEGEPKPGDKPGSERPDSEDRPDEGEPKPDYKPGSRPGNAPNPGQAPADNTAGSRSQKASQRKPVKLKESRAFCTNPDTASYQVSVIPDKDGVVMLKIGIVGEDEADAAEIQSAVMKGSGAKVPVRADGILGPIAMKAGEKSLLQIELKDKYRYALEVSIHEA